MNRKDLLHWSILGFGLAAPEANSGRSTNLSELWQNARQTCADCDKTEVLDALYILPREEAALIKFLSIGEGNHPVSFERVRNTQDWPAYFTEGDFSVKVLPEGETRYREFSEQLEKTAAR